MPVGRRAAHRGRGAAPAGWRAAPRRVRPKGVRPKEVVAAAAAAAVVVVVLLHEIGGADAVGCAMGDSWS